MLRRIIDRISVSGVLLISLLAVRIPAARAQFCPANVPHVDGVWKTLPYLMPINPISATLLSSGRILIVSGSENDAYNNSAGSESYRIAEWDPSGTDESSVVVQNIDYDVFCSGTAVLPDGRPLVVGGTLGYPSFTGDNRASIYDPLTGQFPQTESMHDGRWYATATTLGDGRVSAFSGYDPDGYITNTLEIYDLGAAGVGWGNPITAPFVPPLYPRMELLPNGKVFFTGQGAGPPTSTAWLFDPSNQSWAASATTTADRHYGSAVMLPLLPPDYKARVLSLGGGSPALSSTEIINLSASQPTWRSGPSMSTGRSQMDATLLPNGTVLAQGGSVKYEVPDLPGKHADIYHPGWNAFGSGGTGSYSRLYHSTALLLPDATVISLGSNPGGVRGSYQPAIEIYTPAYLFDANDRPIEANRPIITGVSAPVLAYGASFSVSYTSASAIASAVLMRPGSVTHAFDMDQRMVGLCGASPQPACSPGSGTLSLTTPPNGNIAPPGYYMLFLLDSAGVPSKAQFIQLSQHPSAPPTAVITSPASDMTIVAGNSVNFGTTSSSSQYSWVFPGGWPATSPLQNPGNVTFSTPGSFLASLTAIDSSGNTDPSPPTRKITVIPATPDFSIEVSPPAIQVFPGGSASFQITVTPQSGFNAPVNLSVDSEYGIPAGVSSGGFSPSSISGGGSSTLSMDTTSGVSPYAISLTITGTSGSLTHTASTTLLVNLAPPANLAASTANSEVSLAWTGSAGASGYHIKRSLTAGGPYIGIGCAATPSFNDTGVVNGTAYYYVVSADYTGGNDDGGESADSNEASVTAIVGAPLPPTKLTAAPGLTSGRVRLHWTQSPTPGITKNNIYRRLSWTGFPSTPSVTIKPNTTYADTGLMSGYTYCYRVTAALPSGESVKSNAACAVAR